MKICKTCGKFHNSKGTQTCIKCKLKTKRELLEIRKQPTKSIVESLPDYLKKYCSKVIIHE